jgi:hypothetical protein
MTPEYGNIAQWVQSGGVVAFAVLVYFELRAVRPLLRSLDLAIQALLERERMVRPTEPK